MALGAPPETEDPVDVSLGSIASMIGTVLLVGLAALGVYVDGAIFIYIGFIQPGAATAIATVYVILAVAVPILVARRMRRRNSTWRWTLTVSTALTVAVSVVFLPLAAAMLM